MPAVVYERTFRVRLYECDPYGHVNHANYVRYMQETAFDASAAVGYPLDWYDSHGRAWVIRETDITYLKPLRYGDTVTVRTWVSDFRRVHCRRTYELRNTEGELVAQAHTDWVYMDQETQRLVTVPPEMIAAFMPEGPPPRRLREPFPKAPPPPPGVYVVHRPVAWQDLDTQQHVNNAVYLDYLEESGIGVAAVYGWSMSRMIDEGFGIVARRYRIEYLAPAVLGDELRISTWVSDVKRATAVRHYRIERQEPETLLARAHVLWVWVDLETGRPVRIPENFRRDFAPNFVAE